MSRQYVISSEDETEAFLYHVTHDLRGYVRALRTIPDWIDEDLAAADAGLPPDVAAHLGLLREYASGLDVMLTALTELSRVGRLADKSRSIDLWPLLRTIWAKLPAAEGFHLDLHGTGAQVLGPENDFARLFEAVLRNAVDHHDAARGHVHVTARETGARVFIRVEDDGPGIAKEFRTRVFKPLQGLRPRSETGRVGMGLAIAQKVVAAQAGRIRVTEPDVLSGCALEFDLPAAPST